MLENVNYDFYKTTLGRSAVPDEAAFNEYAAENKLFIKRLITDGVIVEREKDGIDSAVCMMIETDYNAALEMSGNAESGAVASETINGYSYSYDRTIAQETARLNIKSTEAKKYKWLKLYCDVIQGVM